jgi:hypothetical protein
MIVRWHENHSTRGTRIAQPLAERYGICCFAKEIPDLGWRRTRRRCLLSACLPVHRWASATNKGDAMKRLPVMVMALTMIGVLGWAAPSQAALITYTGTTIASGTLGLNTFTNAEVTIELTADTSGVIEPDPVDIPGFLNNAGTATLTIAGLETATFNDPDGYSAVFFPATVLPVCPCVGIFESGTAIIGLLDASLAGYDLQSAFGPLTGTGSGLVTNPDGSPVAFSTTAGALFLTGGVERVTFTVTVAAVPEPASLSLFAVGALGAIAARRRRQRQNA